MQSKKHSAGTKRGASEISDIAISGAEVSRVGTKLSVGKMGVHFYFHNQEEYNQLTKEQKEEVCKFRKHRDTKKCQDGQRNSSKQNSNKCDNKT